MFYITLSMSYITFDTSCLIFNTLNEDLKSLYLILQRFIQNQFYKILLLILNLIFYKKWTQKQT